MGEMETRENTIHFDEGLFGFEKYRSYLPIAVEEGSDAVIVLQNVEDENLSFTIMNPFLLVSDYDPSVNVEELKSLGEAKESDYSWYVICTSRTPVKKSTVNLKCPIVVNTVTGKAKQVILERSEYGFRHTLEELTQKEKEKC